MADRHRAGGRGRLGAQRGHAYGTADIKQRHADRGRVRHKLAALDRDHQAHTDGEGAGTAGPRVFAPRTGPGAAQAALANEAGGGQGLDVHAQCRDVAHGPQQFGVPTGEAEDREDMIAQLFMAYRRAAVLHIQDVGGDQAPDEDVMMNRLGADFGKGTKLCPICQCGKEPHKREASMQGLRAGEAFKPEACPTYLGWVSATPTAEGTGATHDRARGDAPRPSTRRTSPTPRTSGRTIDNESGEEQGHDHWSK